MGKKRIKGKTAPSDDSLDTLEPVCKHIRKGLEQGHLKKALLNVEWHVCQDCKADNKTQEKSEKETDESPSIWLCLKCGHRGCGRNSQEQHALKHYTTPRSDPHCLVLSLDNWSVWCYICDNEVLYNTSTRLGQTVDYVRKQVCTDSSRTEKQQENKEFGNKKVEKDSKNEQEKEVSLKEENSHSSTNLEVTVKGLSNLGNTCFFNAVMQNLSQTPVLRELLKEAKMPGATVKIESPELSMEPQLIKLDQPGPLTLAMYQFLTEMQETKKGVVTPKELFAQVCKKAIRFKGYQQQDSHELLRYLLDGMRAEEIQQVSVGILKALTDSNKQNEELKKKIKEYEKKKGIRSFVDRIFGGELTSTIMCEECRTVSLVHEPFLDLSLPVLDDQKVKITNERNVKKKQEKESEDEEDKINDCYLKQRDEPPGTSKHLQKKAKKQAKKQAKSQRRQQKLQGKVLHLTDICATEQSEKDVEYNQESEAEINSETPDMKQEEESSNDCKDHCLTQKDLSIQGNSTEVQSLHENTGKPEQERVENESLVDLPMERLDSPIKFVNGLDNLSLKDKDDENEDEEEELATSFSKLHLGASAESDMSILDDLETVPVKMGEVLTEDPETAFCTLANREDLNPEEGSIYHCLYQFTRNEKLTETNKLLCDVCTQRHYGPKKNIKSEKKHVYTNAKKQMLISLAPPILTLHLKRFQQAGFNLRKVNRHIKFPEVIDLAPFCTVKCKNVAEGNTKVLYSLYGVVEHSGTMRSGHYTAYAKMRSMNNHLSDLVLRGQCPQALETEPVKGQWFHISDTHVQAVPTSKVLSSQAYLLFYERLL
ncbi:PREDICTED: ubiquitin carboxyl-terminal hydrolase 16 isoform X2 [Nipponia nippon]|uniref:ubiquitin carboxyl-terminal hydrolase 16 isoform X2 n=1 Tax=Nipponia nippon TaxID=128390 RepID=UPI000510FEF5|nr:PREDICTED: ubiquitin carboxyl-terminal hydrolase 16 isoform X2 [Nipponia nippon]